MALEVETSTMLEYKDNKGDLHLVVEGVLVVEALLQNLQVKRLPMLLNLRLRNSWLV